MQPSVTIELPLPTYQQLAAAAQRRHRPIPEYVQQLLAQESAVLPPLPTTLADELSAFTQLSSDVLWILAQSVLTESQRLELANLNEKAQQVEGLTVMEERRQEELVTIYENNLVRRTKALDLLRRRGEDISGIITSMPI
ncbi:MAG TPA: hypothetical protein P5121_30325 [Caldilineaceae bacterium]|nr:hypothetical protein [Caldilineaceae bacterium]